MHVEIETETEIGTRGPIVIYASERYFSFRINIVDYNFAFSLFSFLAT